MKRRALRIALILLLPAAAGADVDTLRALTYNIYYGGQDHDPVFGRDEEWLDLIRTLDPDLLFVEEANGWLPSEQGLLAAYVESLNASFPSEAPYAGFIGAAPAFHVAIVTRLPVLDFEAFGEVQVGEELIDISHVFTHATLDLGADTAHAIGVHFKSGAARADREREARALLAILETLPPEETVWIGGDFNSYSPDDLVPGGGLEPDYAGGALAADVKGWEPAGYLRDEGYEDAYRISHPSTPGYTQNTLSFLPPGTMGPVQRVDFLFRSPGSAWRLDSAEPVTGAPGDIASDHYAVGATYVHRPWTGVEADEDGARAAPASLRIAPHPAGAGSRLSYTLARNGPVRLLLFSPSGRLLATLADRSDPAGTHEIVLDPAAAGARGLPPGVYFLRFESGGSAETARFIWLGGDEER